MSRGSSLREIVSSSAHDQPLDCNCYRHESENAKTPELVARPIRLRLRCARDRFLRPSRHR